MGFFLEFSENVVKNEVWYTILINFVIILVNNDECYCIFVYFIVYLVKCVINFTTILVHISELVCGFSEMSQKCVKR